MTLTHNDEQKWALGTLAIFGILILFAGLSDFTDIGITISTFLISWLAVSYSIRRFGKGGTSNEEIQKEMQIFSIEYIEYQKKLCFICLEKCAQAPITQKHKELIFKHVYPPPR